MPRTIHTLNQEIARELASVSDTPRLDAQVLLAHILGCSRAWLLAHSEAELPPEKEESLAQARGRLRNGMPLPYVIGHWEFYGIDFALTPAVLIPRPETELLVVRALAWLQSQPVCCLAVDVGTGSGCIAISLAVHSPGLRVVAVDVSLDALQLAGRNAAACDVADQVFCLQADLLAPFTHTPPPLHLICANLPYIPTATLAGLAVARCEPRQALDGGPDGLALIRRLLAQAQACLAPEGLMLLEIETSQGQAALTLARAAFPAAQVSLHQDLAGHDRLVEILT